MKVDVQEVGACKRRLEVEEGPEVVQQAWERAFARVQKEARLPGFRKGKVPRSMIKLHFSDDVRQEVARHLIPEVYRQALAETRLRPVEEPDLQEVTLEESAPLKSRAKEAVYNHSQNCCGDRNCQPLPGKQSADSTDRTDGDSCRDTRQRSSQADCPICTGRNALPTSNQACFFGKSLPDLA